MKTKIEIAPKYSFLKEEIQSISENFSSLGILVFSGTYETRSVIYKGINIEIKHFKYNNLLDRFYYSRLKKSKAQLTYKYSEQLINLGITSPEHVAYLCRYKYGMLSEDFYVYANVEYDVFENLINQPLLVSLNALKAFACFSYSLHKHGIFHKEYTTQNVSFALKGDQYDFALVDISQMSFSRFSIVKGVKNLQRLYLPADYLSIVVSEYAQKAKIDGLKALGALLLIKKVPFIPPIVLKGLLNVKRYL